MKSVVLPIAPLMVCAALSAQGVFSNKTQAILEKVIQDYPHRFIDIKGEQVAQTHEATEYRSTVQLPGSSGIITRTNTPARDPAREEVTWSCSFFEPAGFERAKSRYREVFDQIRNSIITGSDQKTFILTTGQYQDPASDKKYSHVFFSLLPGVGAEKRLHVELSLHEEARGWKITLSVYDHEPAGDAQIASTQK
ncbi:MAG: hypothetical protein Q8927_13095 [Bacteroidota bacterium]|nr:hypothetical protein [Bacteroidota bacterium]MDP4217131.1 hypothetical protein [Bacteroidota bacterium]MDP4244933.1 hypothetical protein [Bacteroidota bacterium]MDP4252603.1 hypothetical protein [Bacteroidota bacterium]MDP4258451.1 hypothetical protein [Bacteroidota bacterium]